MALNFLGWWVQDVVMLHIGIYTIITIKTVLTVNQILTLSIENSYAYY